MGSLTDYAENELMDHWLNAAYSSVATVYLALHTADPTDAGTGAEVTNANGYARTAISFGNAAARRVTQDADVTFPVATGNWPSAVTHYAIWDNGTHGAGNMLAHGAFNASFQPVTGNTPIVASGQVYVEISATAGGAGYTNYLVHKLLDLMFNNTAFSKPDTFLLLSNSVMDDADVAIGDITEVTGTSYARKQVNPNGGASPTWTVSSGGAVTNSGIAAFPTVGAGGWTQLVAVGIIDSTSGAGNILAYDSDNVVNQTPVVNDIVRFEDGAFDLALT